jgi:hypothetical protein
LRMPADRLPGFTPRAARSIEEPVQGRTRVTSIAYRLAQPLRTAMGSGLAPYAHLDTRDSRPLCNRNSLGWESVSSNAVSSVQGRTRATVQSRVGPAQPPDPLKKRPLGAPDLRLGARVSMPECGVEDGGPTACPEQTDTTCLVMPGT